MQEMLKITGIRKSFSTLDVLKGVDLTVHKGEVVSLIGPSGSGKTTLLRCANFLDQAEDGTMVLDGQTYHLGHVRRTEMYEARRHTAFVFQNYNLFLNKTALQNVTEGLIVARKMPRDEAEARAQKALEKVGLGNRGASYPNQLSGGQQQRVAIARAIATDPKIIYFDEPTSALDPELTVEVLAVMRDLAADGMTMLVVTHEMGFARNVSNQVVFMEHGVVVEQGEVKEIFANPKTAAAKRLVAPNGGSAARDLSSFAPDDHVVRVTFNGSSAAKPLVASLAAEKGILVSVLSADTRDLSGQCYGSMLLKLPADLDEAKQAAAYMRAQPGITVEEVTGE